MSQTVLDNQQDHIAQKWALFVALALYQLEVAAKLDKTSAAAQESQVSVAPHHQQHQCVTATLSEGAALSLMAHV
jgi:hypothetical protein